MEASTQFRRPAVLVVSALVLALLVAQPTPAHAARGAMFGAHVDRGGSDRQSDSIQAFEDKLGRQLDIVNRYHPFDGTSMREEELHIFMGRVPMISWRATVSGTDSNRANKIANGRFDDEIDEMARAVRQLRSRVLIRFNWEMDQEPGGRQYIGSPDEFIAAWRHVVRRFRALNVDNAEFVWAPRANAFNKGTAQPFYPGDSWVDWIGGSAVPITSVRSFHDKFEGFLEWGAARNKPLLTWIGVREQANDPDFKPRYINRMHDTVRNHPAIDAFLWYQAISPKGNDYRADTSARSWRQFKQMACDPWFDQDDRCNGGGGGGGDEPPSGTVQLRGSGSSGGYSWHPMEVPVRATGEMEVTLTWSNPDVNMYIFVRRPGASDNFRKNKSNARPKSLTVPITRTGTYTVIAKVKSGGFTNFTLTATPPS